jgi:ATP-binding cassette subfamily F protein uup
MSILAAHGLSKSFGPRTILDSVSLAVKDGERIGLLGANGAGKSTLARILAGIELPDAGELMTRREATVAYLAQEPVLDAASTPRREVLLGLSTWSEAHDRYERASAMLSEGSSDAALLAEQASAAADVERLGGWQRNHEVQAMLAHLGVTRIDAPIAELSGGDRRRVALARILVARPTLAILDEPSNHLDADTIAWLEEYLVSEYGGSVLLVTHDRYLLDRVVTRTLEIDKGQLYSYPGGYQDYLEARAERAGLEQRTEQNRQNFLRRELEWLRRQPKARTGKQKARISRAEIAKDAPRPKAERSARLELETTRAGKSVLEISGLTLAYGERTVVRDLDLIVSPGDRIGVVGPNGAGKTSLLRAILGELAPLRGRIVRGQNVALGYFDQHRAGLDGAASIFDNVAGDRSRVELGGQSLEVRSYLERFLFRADEQRQPVGALSGGERARVALAKMLSYPANLILLDEPTNDLDVAMLGSLEDLLLTTRASAIVVTHDRWFLDKIATAILAFEKDGRVVRYEGNYQIYCQLRPESSVTAEPQPALASKPAPALRKESKKGLSYHERRELDGIVERVDAAEQLVATLEAELADPTLYALRGAELPQLLSRLEVARGEAARLMARWEELSSRE